MRKRADWMVPPADAILKYVRNAGEVPPTVIGRDIDSHPNYASQGCRILTEHGLLDRETEGYELLTELGHQYLEEELAPGELEGEGK